MADRDRLTYKLSDEINDAIFSDAIAPASLYNLKAQSKPHALFIGGQPGSGKTALQQAISGNVDFDFTSVVKVIGDEYRPYHPKYDILNGADDTLAAFYTDADAGVWVTKAINLVKSSRSNILIEGTLRRAEVTIGTAKELVDNDYSCELHLLVVNEFISRLRIFSRYLGQKKRDGYGRYTLLDAHNASYEVLPAAIKSILSSKLFSQVVLYDAENEVLFDSKHYKGDVIGAVASIVKYTRNKLHQPLDKILADIQSLRKLAAALECNNLVIDDISKLEQDVIAAASAYSTRI